MAPIIGAVLGTVVDAVAGWWKRREETRAMEHQTTMEIAKAEAEAKIARLASAQTHEQEWEIESIKQSGWKDEWFVILFSVPVIMCFIPGGSQYVTAGFDALSGTPEWFQWSFIVAVASSFGFRKLTDLVSTIRGK